MVIGKKTDGRKRFIRTLAMTSNAEYEMKKMVSVRLYCDVDMGTSVVRCAILAFPMLVRSRKAIR